VTAIQVLVKLLITGAAILVIGLMCFIGIALLRRALRIHNDRIHTLRLKNDGNIPSFYLIAIDSPEPALNFQLSVNNIPLINNPVLVTQPVANANPSPQQKASNKNSQAGSQGINSGSAVQTGRAAASKLGAASGFLAALGNLLPGELGSNLRSRSAEVRNIQQEATQAVDAPVSMQRQVGELQRQTGTLGGNAQGNPSGSPAARDASVVSQPSAQKSYPVAGSSANPGVYSVRTTEIQPGTSQSITLKIGTKKWRYPYGSFLYTIQSEQVPVEPLDIQIPKVRREGLVHFEKVESWRYWLAPLTSICVIILSLFMLTFSLTFIW